MDGRRETQNNRRCFIFVSCSMLAVFFSFVLRILCISLLTISNFHLLPVSFAISSVVLRIVKAMRRPPTTKPVRRHPISGESKRE